MTGFHDKGHVHSTYFNVAMLREAIPHQFWLNPVDAAQRGLKSGDIAEIYNERGRLHIRVKVTRSCITWCDCSTTRCMAFT